MSSDLSLCEEITRELMKLPGSLLFADGFNEEENRKNYKKLKDPQFLPEILQKLENKEYKTPKEWEKDVSTAWNNIPIFYGNNSYYASISKHLSKKCEKLKRRLNNKKKDFWIKSLVHRCEKIDKLFFNCPFSLNYEISSDRAEFVAPEYPEFSSYEKDCLIEASRRVGGGKDVLLNLSKILTNDIDIEDRENLIINIEELSERTQHNLRSYFKRILKENYPE